MVNTKAPKIPLSYIYGWAHWIILSILLVPFFYILAAKAANITTNPGDLYWSEFSNIFNASRFFSSKLYGEQLALPLLDPARMFLDSLVFLLPSRSLLMYRAWVTFISVLIPLLTAYAFSKKIAGLHTKLIPVVTLLGFLFLQQGPIYYHVLLGPLFVLWFYDQDRLWKRILIVSIASLWAGLCRINWIPFPGILIAVLYLLETPIQTKNIFKYLSTPAILVLAGTFAGLVSYFGYAWLTGNPLVHLDPSYNYSFYWRRLFPNSNFVLGVFPGTLLVSFPLLVASLTWYWHNRSHVHWLRVFFIAASFAVFALGGLIVSIRIGGTFNLHNMDGFLILVFTTGGFIFFNRAVGEKRTIGLRESNPGFYPVIALLILLIPLSYNLYFTRVRVRPNVDTVDYRVIQQLIDQHKDERPVLFLDFRHLITFGQLEADIYQPYDKVIVMENVMANRKQYIDEFTAKVINQEFSVIISPGEFYPRYFTQLTNILAPEENGWSENISIPIVDYYEPIHKELLYIYIPQKK